MAAATARSIPVFANVSMPGLNCTPPPCPTIVTTEWIPSLITGAVVGSLLTATLIGAAWLVRR